MLIKYMIYILNFMFRSTCKIQPIKIVNCDPENNSQNNVNIIRPTLIKKKTIYTKMKNKCKSIFIQNE